MSAEARKNALRVAAMQARKAAFQDGDPAAGAARLLEVLGEARDRDIAGYMPMRSEIDPLPAMAALACENRIGVPVIPGKAVPLVFHRWTPDAAMRAGTFGARVPETAQEMTPDILIVPLVAFDRRGGRLGYGGGYYDRTLEMLRARRKTLAIGFAWAAQEIDDLPQEPTDQPLDMVVTEREMIHIGEDARKGG